MVLRPFLPHHTSISFYHGKCLLLSFACLLEQLV
jgi:hypothetical protein